MTGEVGLSGEIRPVTRLAERIREAERLGLTDILVPGDASSLKAVDQASLSIRLHPVARVADAFRVLFG